MVKFTEFLVCMYICFVCQCTSQYVVHFGIFVDDLSLYSSLTDSFITTANPSSFYTSVNYYNETSTLVLDGEYITEDIAYGTNNSFGAVLINVDTKDSSLLCHVAQWANASYVRLSQNTHQDCTPTFLIQPTLQEYMEIAIPLFQMSGINNLDVILLVNEDFDIDSSVFTSNDTLYAIRSYNLNSSVLDTNLLSSINDGAINRIIVIGTNAEITDVLLAVNTSLNAKRDQWIVIPTDSFQCPNDNTSFSFVCIIHSDANVTVQGDVSQFIYMKYLTKLWQSIGIYTDNNLYLTQNLNDYLEASLNSTNTSTKLNVIKLNITDNGLTEVLIGEWTRRTGLEMTDVAFPEITDNKLRVVVIHEPPFISRMITDSGEEYYYGYTIDILSEIARRVGFEFSLYYVPDGEYGVLRSDGTWSGLIGEVSKGAADIAAGPISVTAERETVIDFSAPYYDFAGLQLLMRDPTVYNDMFAFASAFTGVVWVTWFSIQISTAVILYFFHRLQLKTFAEKPQHNPFNFKECVWFVMGSITLAGADRSPITFSSRLLVAGFWFFCQIMMGTYTANLAAFMTSSRLSYSIESLEDLATQTSVSYSVLKGTVGETYFSRMSNIEKNFYDLWKEMSYESDDPGNFAVWEYPLGEKYTKIWNQILNTGLIQTSEGGISRLMSDNFAYIHETPMIKYEMNRQCGLLTIGSPFSSKPYALALQQNSPLVETISKTILQMQSETVITELKDKWWKNSTATCPTTEENQGLSMKAVGGIFIVMSIGCGISFLILLIELLWHKYKSAKQNKIKVNENKMEMKENMAFEEKDDLTITRKVEDDNLSVIDLNRYNHI